MGTHISESASFVPFLRCPELSPVTTWRRSTCGPVLSLVSPRSSPGALRILPTPKKDEVTIVQIEGEGYNKSKVMVPICAMKGGKDTQQYVDLLVPCPAKLTLMQGEGPIYLVGSHCVDFYGYRDTGAGDDEDEDEATEDEGDVSMNEAEELVKDAKGDVKEKKGTPSKEEKKTTPAKDEKQKTPAKEEKKKTPAKEAEKKTPAKDEKEKTPAKEDKKRKASEDQPKSGEK